MNEYSIVLRESVYSIQYKLEQLILVKEYSPLGINIPIQAFIKGWECMFLLYWFQKKW